MLLFLLLLILLFGSAQENKIGLVMSCRPWIQHILENVWSMILEKKKIVKCSRNALVILEKWFSFLCSYPQWEWTHTQVKKLCASMSVVRLSWMGNTEGQSSSASNWHSAPHDAISQVNLHMKSIQFFISVVVAQIKINKKERR